MGVCARARWGWVEGVGPGMEIRCKASLRVQGRTNGWVVHTVCG